MKTFRYLAGADFRQVTEAQVRESMEALPAESPLRAEAERVLGLAIGEELVTANGIQFTRLDDDAPTFSAFICNRGRSRRCGFCKKLVASGDGLLCDGSPSKRGKETCDAFMCRGCAKHVGPNRDFCPRCAGAEANA